MYCSNLLFFSPAYLRIDTHAIKIDPTKHIFWESVPSEIDFSHVKKSVTHITFSVGPTLVKLHWHITLAQYGYVDGNLLCIY